MMGHFKLKSLTFYGIAIGSVVLLFRVVTAYGENNLKAPPAVGGSYRINAQNLPGCLKSDALMLDIKQSGIYLFGSLLPAKTDVKTATIAEEKPTLIGRFNNQQLILEGPVPWVTNCNQLVGQANQLGSTKLVKIQGVIKEKTLTGQITLSSTPTAAEFTAQQEPPDKQKP